MAALHVFIDTNALPRYTRQVSKDFQRLCQLSEMGVVEIYLSEVVLREWRSQWHQAFTEQVVKTATSMALLLQNPLAEAFSNVPQLHEAQAQLQQMQQEQFAEGKALFERIVHQMQAQVIEIAPDHGMRVVESYFAGSSPFKHNKSRDDFPDAFIYAAAVDLVQQADITLHCIGADGTLRTALSSVPSVIVYKDVWAFLRVDALLAEVRRVMPEAAWQDALAQAQATLPQLTEQVTMMIAHQETYFNEIAYCVIEHPQLPSEDREATVAAIGDPENMRVNWENSIDLGAGELAVSVKFESNADIDFYVFHADAYDIPENVWVSYGDHEHQHYFDAGAEVRLQITATLVLTFEWDDQAETWFTKVVRAEVAEIDDIVVLEDETGSIFRTRNWEP